MKFKDLNLQDYLIEAIDELGFKELTKVQEQVMKKVKDHKNIVCQSATGSGKTHAFLIPLINKLDLNNHSVQVVIISPTRELATQLYEDAIFITKRKDIDVRLFIGGTSTKGEIKKLEASQPQIVIGTMGRIYDLAVKENALKIYLATDLVIDEADMVLEEKALIDADQVLALLNNQPRFWLFSATFTKPMKVFINKYIGSLDEVIIEEENLTKSSIEHLFIPCKAKDKREVLMDLLNTINPYLAIIFVNKLEDVDSLSKYLAEKNIKVGILHGALDDRARKQTLKRIKNNEYQYVVASDIASRGIDIEGISHVINFDLPKDIEFYIHRTGRTARYDMEGQAISLYDYDDEQYVEKLKAKGLIIHFYKIVDNHFVLTKVPKKRINTKRKTLEESVHLKYPKPKQVKPGYKKKRMEKINKEIKKMEKARISEIYRKKKRNEDRMSR